MDTNSKKGILWFRNDLRIHDHEALNDAINHGTVYPIYVFDERVFQGVTEFGFRKTDVFRARFIIESIHDLRQSIRALGSDLIVRVGKPEEVISQLAHELKTNWVFCNRERTQEELDVQDALERALWAIGQELRYSRGKMLYYTSDLPFPVTHSPDSFTQFRKEVEKFIQVRDPLPSPVSLPAIQENFDVGEIPSLETFGFSQSDIERSNSKSCHGGETKGLERLKEVFEAANLNLNYTNQVTTEIDNSTRLSAYFSQGCLSPKKVYQALTNYEERIHRNEWAHGLLMELLWRDFFRLIGKKFGNSIFLKGGPKGIINNDLQDNLDVFRIWAEARTGIPIVDAAMRELNTTGFMPFKARQNAASFLINELQINWQLGASYFESLLIDYDPCSNWGNWNTIAGVGVDPKESGIHNVVKHAKRYDPDGKYVKKWIPSLEKLTDNNFHEPFLLTEEEQEKYDFILGKDYPRACIKMS